MKKEYPKLEFAVKHKILTALRSGKYKFIKGTLCSSSGQYCTLGAIYREFNVPIKVLLGRGNISSSELPESVMKCLAMFTSNSLEDVGDRIIGINDTMGNDSYEKTANWIEENL